MKRNGPPSRKNIYVFNGDIADRGKHAVEIFTLLALFYLGILWSATALRVLSVRRDKIIQSDFIRLKPGRVR